jgi:hypothetical protein
MMRAIGSAVRDTILIEPLCLDWSRRTYSPFYLPRE